MASALIRSIRTVSGNQPEARRVKEKAAQTFKAGVPLDLDAGGFVKEWDGADLTEDIIGISQEAGANLTTDGVPKTLTFGSVPNQAAAVNIPRGAPINDGRIGFDVANLDTVWFGQVSPAQTALQADIGINYGLTKDADGQWFVDKAKTGAAAAVRIVALDQNDTVRGVHFVFLNAVIAQL